jgi:hypothetical protein
LWRKTHGICAAKNCQGSCPRGLQSSCTQSKNDAGLGNARWGKSGRSVAALIPSTFSANPAAVVGQVSRVPCTLLATIGVEVLRSNVCVVSHSYSGVRLLLGGVGGTR